ATTTRAHVLDERLSLGVSVVLIVVYVANLFYTLVTHRDVFEGTWEGKAEWSLRKTLVVAREAELVSGALEPTAKRLGLSLFFLGVIVLPLVGNAAEYASALYFARRDHMGLVMTIS